MTRPRRPTRCASCAGARRSTPSAVAASAQPFDLDVGPGPDGAPLVVYSRAGDLFQFDPATRLEQPLAEVNTPGTEVHPSIRRDALAFVRTARGSKARPVLYLRKNGNTRKQPRPRFKRTLAIEDVELSDRGLFVVYRTDIVPTCCTSAVLYRVSGKKLRARLPGRQRRRELRPAGDAERVRPQRLLRAHERGLGPGEQPVPLRPADRRSCSPRAGRGSRRRSPGAATASSWAASRAGASGRRTTTRPRRRPASSSSPTRSRGGRRRSATSATRAP